MSKRSLAARRSFVGAIAQQLTDATGRAVSFVDVAPDAAAAELVASGLPTWWAEYRVGV